MVATLAERQHGVVARATAARAGARARARSSAGSRAGACTSLHRGCLRGRPPADLTRGTVDGGGSRLRARRGPEPLVGGGALGIMQATRPSRIEVTVAQRSRSSERFAGTSPTCPRRGHREEGIPVTTVPARSSTSPPPSRADAVESRAARVRILRLHDRLSLPDLLERYPGDAAARDGPASPRRACGEDPRGRKSSALEERFAALPRASTSLPLPRFNAWLDLGGRRFQVDCLWPEPGRIVELDGWEATAPAPPSVRTGPATGACRRRLRGHPHHLEPARRRTRAVASISAAPSEAHEPEPVARQHLT